MSKGYAAPILLLFIVAVSILVWTAYNLGKNGIKVPQNQENACTMEAKICPDGSSVGRTGENCEFAPCPTPNPLSIVLPQGWKIYEGQCGYSFFKECPYVIGFPEDWLLVEEKNQTVLYPDKKEDINAPRFILGTGGKDAPGPGKLMDFKAGEASYWKTETGNGLYLTVSFDVKDINYIFEGENLKPEHEEIFLKMVDTFSY